MQLTDTQVSWLQRNKAMSGNSGSTPPAALPTIPPQVLATADSSDPTSAPSAQVSSVPASSAPGGGTAAPPPDGPPLPATDTILYFALGSSDLTPSDIVALDGYAQAFSQNPPDQKIDIEGWASIDGDPNFNRTLSTARATAVANYLISKGVGAHKLSNSKGSGNGPTSGFSTSDPRYNRCVTISPKLPAPSATSQPWTFNPAQPTAPNLNLPPPPPIPPAPDPSDPNAQYDAQGYSDGVNGRNGVCLVDPQADKAYQGGYARGTDDRQKWQQTLDAVKKLRLPDTTGLPSQSASDVLAKALEAGLKGLIDKLPQPLRDPARKAIPGIVASAVAAAAKAGISDSAAAAAAAALTEAVLRLKDAGPPMDRKQDTSGPEAPVRDPPQGTPPQASPPTPPSPGVITSPPFNTPDTPPPKPSLKTDGSP